MESLVEKTQNVSFNGIVIPSLTLFVECIKIHTSELYDLRKNGGLSKAQMRKWSTKNHNMHRSKKDISQKYKTSFYILEKNGNFNISN